MIMNVLEVQLGPNDALLVTTLTYALAYAIRLNKDEDYSSKMDALFIGICEKYNEFQKMPDDVPYDEHEWAHKIITNALKYVDAAQAGHFSGSIIARKSSDDDSND